MMATSTSTGFPCQKIQLICHNTTNNNYYYYMMMRNSAPSLLPMPTAITTVGSISRTSLISRVLSSRANCHKNKWMIVKAANSKSTETSSSDKQQKEGEQEYEEYEAVLEKPYGLKFVKGRDGGTHIDAIAPGLSADKTGMFTVGDKVLATSAVFGDDVWLAAGYGQTMYAIRQRVGPLYMKMQKRYGKTDSGGDLTEKEIIRAERNAGFISNRVREIQLQNYRRKMEQKERREKELREGLELYRSETMKSMELLSHSLWLYPAPLCSALLCLVSFFTWFSLLFFVVNKQKLLTFSKTIKTGTESMRRHARNLSQYLDRSQHQRKLQWLLTMLLVVMLSLTRYKLGYLLLKMLLKQDTKISRESAQILT